MLSRNRHCHAPRSALLLALIAASLVPRTADGAKSCQVKDPDVSVFGITLADSDSAARQVGSGAALKEDAEDLPHARFVSTNGAEELVLFAPYDGGVDEYSEFEVRVAGAEALALQDLPAENFITGRGIALGMSPEAVVERFGKCFKNRVNEDGAEFIQYEIAAANSDPKLKNFGFPVYFAEYEFRERKLVRFRFGFEMP